MKFVLCASAVARKTMGCMRQAQRSTYSVPKVIAHESLSLDGWQPSSGVLSIKIWNETSFLWLFKGYSLELKLGRRRVELADQARGISDL